MTATLPIILANRNDPDILHWDADAGFWRNPARAERVIRFIQNMTIPSGVGQGNKFVLRPWQQKFIRDVYEPVGPDFKRLVRDAVLSMGRKNGKTALIAALVLVHLIGPEWVYNGEIYSGANDREQASIVYKFAAQLVKADSFLDKWLTCVDSTKRIVCLNNGSFYHALSREAGTKHGLNPTFAIYDELAQAKDRNLYDTLNTAFGARDEPLFAVISTQSRDPQHILSELIDAGLSDNDPSVVCHLYAVPDDDEDLDIYDEKVWHQANPALGDFLLLESVRKLAKQAQDSPSFEPSFRNLTLNQRVDSTPSVIHARDWRACENKKSRLYPGEPIYLGLDLSATTDLTALVAVSATDGSRLASWFWKPGDLVREHETRDRAPYERWKIEGHLNAPPGKDIDYELVCRQIVELNEEYEILGIAYDRWRIDTLMKAFARLEIATYYHTDDDIDGDGIRFVPWGQGFKDMAPAIDAVEQAIASRTLSHPGHPILTWCVSNAVATLDPAGNRKLDKSKVRFRIDGAVAMAMAMGLKARDMPDEEGDFDAFISAPLGATG